MAGCPRRSWDKFQEQAQSGVEFRVSSHPGVFLLGLEVNPDEDAVMGDTLHVLEIIFKADNMKLSERRILFAPAAGAANLCRLRKSNACLC